VASAAHAVSLAGDLARSRERLVAATEEERRRLRRDLHDGLGPALAGVVLGLQRARARLVTEPAAAQAQLDELTRQVQEAVADVRRLVYGLRPPAVDELGLVGAIREQAQAMGSVEVHGAVDGDLPAAVEVAAYRIALEAMTNALRHGGGSWCRVGLELNGALHVVVEDDGAGLPEQFRAGVGIASMRERAAELGGSWTIARRDPAGTTVRAVLPVTGAP
jgi:signal transduction histidine kinase